MAFKTIVEKVEELEEYFVKKGQSPNSCVFPFLFFLLCVAMKDRPRATVMPKMIGRCMMTPKFSLLLKQHTDKMLLVSLC